MHNVRVPLPRSRRLHALAALTVASALVLGACSSDSSGSTQKSAATSSAPTPPSPSVSSTVKVPDGVQLTDQGTRLSFGEPAAVIF